MQVIVTATHEKPLNTWQDSGIRMLIVLHRETFNTATQKASADTSYYLSNRAVGNTKDGEALAIAVR